MLPPAVALLLAAAPALADWLTPKDIARVMGPRAKEIRALCWDAAAKKAPTSLKVEFVVSPEGSVRKAIEHEATGVPEIIRCVVSEVKKTKFPATDGGGSNQWPFVFR